MQCIEGSQESPVLTQESPLCTQHSPLCSTEHNWYSNETWGLEIANWRKSSVTSATCPRQSVTPRPRSSSPFIDNSYGLCLHVYIAYVYVYMYVSAHRRLSTAHIDCSRTYMCVCLHVYIACVCICMYQRIAVYRQLIWTVVACIFGV